MLGKRVFKFEGSKLGQILCPDKTGFLSQMVKMLCLCKKLFNFKIQKCGQIWVSPFIGLEYWTGLLDWSFLPF